MALVRANNENTSYTPSGSSLFPDGIPDEGLLENSIGGLAIQIRFSTIRMVFTLISSEITACRSINLLFPN